MSKQLLKKINLRVAYITGAFLGLSFAIVVISAGAFFGYYYSQTPSVKNLQGDSFSQTSLIYDRTGTHVLYELFGKEHRKVVSHQEISDNARLSIIAAEDSGFYQHYGFDPEAIVRAAKTNYERKNISQGASTITQQLARNVYLTNEKTWERKIKELVLAVKIERNFEKDEILDMYLNQVPFGSNIYGIQTASEKFFGKNARDLTLDEAAFLMALPKATTYYSPYGKNTQDLVSRQRYILQRIYDLNLAGAEEVKAASRVDTLKKVNPNIQRIEAPHFVFYVIEQLEEKYGKEALQKGGLKIITTLDYDLQKKGESIVREGAFQNEKRYQAENAALVAQEASSGEILAMVGSRDFFDPDIDGEVNVATRPRQPGSSFKPIVYAKAFEKGYQPESLLYDVRINFGPDGSGKDYIPNNYSNNFRGLVSMRESLSMSLNIPAVETLYLAGVDDSIDLAHKMGISTLQERNRYGLALVLGGGEVKLVDHVSAYSVFANEGGKISSGGILEIYDNTGEKIFEKKRGKEAVLSEDVARKINSVLSDNKSRTPVFGGHSPLYIPGRYVAAKTGTTQEFRDAWTVGYTKDVVVGVWAGNNDNRPMRQGADGVYVAAPIWNKFMQELLLRYSDKPFTPYQMVESTNLMVTGKTELKTVYYKKGTDKKLSEEKAQKTKKSKVEEKQESVAHSILYYVDKDNPLGERRTDYSDPMMWRWEEALGKDFKKELAKNNGNGSG